MSRYVLTQEQLDRLQEQIQALSRLNEAKEERIKELEVHKVRVSSSEVADLIKAIGKLEDEMNDLKKLNKRLSAEVEIGKANATKIREFEILLEEERKLREYYETFARQVELKCAEETHIKNLTKELCQLQKDEIDIENRRILDLQKKLKKFSNEVKHFQVEDDKENKKLVNNASYNKWQAPTPEPIISNVSSKQMPKTQSEYNENLTKVKDLKAIIRNLQNQLASMYDEIDEIPVKTREEQERLEELENWLSEINYVTEDLEKLEDLRKDLNYLKNEIESKRKSILMKDRQNYFYSN